MDWAQVFTIIGVLGAITLYFFNKLDSDVRSQMARIDQLYQMFVDLLKEKK
jgi:biopolymer transport protein ExbB/TolQ